MKAMSMDELDRLLDAARATPPQPRPDLMARILADALAEQPVAAAAPVPVLRRDRPARRGFWAALTEGFGGRGVLAGLGGAACFGLALGYVDPTSLGWLTDGLGGTVSEVQLLPGTDFFLSEG
jgi:hypothetical protein